MPDTPEATAPETILAFDFGLRRIGVAVGQTVTGSASPVGVIANTPAGVDVARIAALIAEWHPQRLVVGLPMHADGSPSEMQKRVESFISDLAGFGVPVETVDERYTSQEAEAALKDARVAGRRGRVRREAVDSAAAVLIAERYLAGDDGSV